MASLSNINGLFDVHSTGAILFSTSHGTSGQILRSNGNAAPTWVAASTVIGGPYLPLAGGTLTGPTATATGINFTVGGNLFGTSATFSASISASGNSNTFGNTTIGALSASTGTFSASITAAGNSNSFGATTFAGNVTITGGTTSGLNITTSGTQDTININRAANNDNAITKYQTASADKWIVGLRNTGDDKFRFYSYGTSTDVLTIDQTNGNVGIGTGTPGAKLHNYSTVSTDVWISGYGTLAQNNWRAGHAIFAAQDNGLLISKANAANNTNRLFSLYHNSGGNSEFYMYDTNSNNKAKINSSGDSFFNGGSVGIGTTTPDAKLQVAAGNGQLQAWFGETSYTSAAIRIGGENTAGGRIYLQYEGDNSYIDSYGGHGSTGRYRDLTMAAQNIKFVTGITGGSEKMRITSTGAISVGTSGTAYGAAGEVLTSNGNTAPSWQAAGGSSPFGQALKTYSSSANVVVATTVNASTVANLVSGHIIITASTGGGIITKTIGIYETSNLWFYDLATPEIESTNNSIVITPSGNATNTLTFTVGVTNPVAGYGMTVSIQASPPGFFNL